MHILLAEPRALTREGLKRVALEIDAASEFVEAADATAARAALHSMPPLDVAMFDEALITPNEVSAWRREHPKLLLIALTACEDVAVTANWLAAGINALVPKSAPIANLSAALRLVMAGDVCVQPGGGMPVTGGIKRTGDARHGAGPLNLTQRQYEVLGLVAQGHSNKAIAEELAIGVRTVKGHVSVILRALRADNRTDAGRSARRWLARDVRR